MRIREIAGDSLPVELVTLTVDKITGTMPKINDLHRDGCRMVMSGMHLVLKESITTNAPPDILEECVHSMTKSVDGNTASCPSRSAEEEGVDVDGETSEGLKDMETLIGMVIANLQAEISDITVEVRTQQEPVSGEATFVKLSAAKVTFRDVSDEVAPDRATVPGYDPAELEERKRINVERLEGFVGRGYGDGSSGWEIKEEHKIFESGTTTGIGDHFNILFRKATPDSHAKMFIAAITKRITMALDPSDLTALAAVISIMTTVTEPDTYCSTYDEYNGCSVLDEDSAPTISFEMQIDISDIRLALLLDSHSEAERRTAIAPLFLFQQWPLPDRFLSQKEVACDHLEILFQKLHVCLGIDRRNSTDGYEAPATAMTMRLGDVQMSEWAAGLQIPLFRFVQVVQPATHHGSDRVTQVPGDLRVSTFGQTRDRDEARLTIDDGLRVKLTGCDGLQLHRIIVAPFWVTLDPSLVCRMHNLLIPFTSSGRTNSSAKREMQCDVQLEYARVEIMVPVPTYRSGSTSIIHSIPRGLSRPIQPDYRIGRLWIDLQHCLLTVGDPDTGTTAYSSERTPDDTESTIYVDASEEDRPQISTCTRVNFCQLIACIGPADEPVIPVFSACANNFGRCNTGLSTILPGCCWCEGRQPNVASTAAGEFDWTSGSLEDPRCLMTMKYRANLRADVNEVKDRPSAFSHFVRTDTNGHAATEPADAHEATSFKDASKAEASVIVSVNLPVFRMQLSHSEYDDLYKLLVDLSVFEIWTPQNNSRAKKYGKYDGGGMNTISSECDDSDGDDSDDILGTSPDDVDVHSVIADTKTIEIDIGDSIILLGDQVDRSVTVRLLEASFFVASNSGSIERTTIMLSTNGVTVDEKRALSTTEDEILTSDTRKRGKNNSRDDQSALRLSVVIDPPAHSGSMKRIQVASSLNGIKAQHRFLPDAEQNWLLWLIEWSDVLDPICPGVLLGT